MPASQTPLPEGTDSIISDTGGEGGLGGYGAGTASGSSDPSSATSRFGAATEKVGEATAKVGEATAGLRAQASEKALGLASQGKDRAVGLLDNVTKLVDDAAGKIDEQAGERYGAYARQASSAVAGLADSLRERDVDALIGDARELVRKSPAIAIGAAAAIGFVVARLLKVGLSDETPAASGTIPPTPVTTPSTATTVAADLSY